MKFKHIYCSLIISLLTITACDEKKETIFDVQFDQTEVQFGKIEINQTVSKKVRIKNTENSTDTFVGTIKILDSPAFTMDFSGVLTLQKNESKEVYVTFRPTNGQSYTGKMNILDEEENFISEMYLYGEGATPVSFTYDKSKLEFGLVNSGDTKLLDISITNSASSGFDLELSLSIPISDFTIANNIQSLTLLPGITEKITIQYSPTVTTSSKSLRINHNSSVRPNPSEVQLTGIMDETSSIVSSIKDGWTQFESGKYSDSRQSFNNAMNKARVHVAYDSIYGESMHGRGWAALFNTASNNNALAAYNDFVATAKDYNNKVSDVSLLDCLAGKAISGVLIGSSVERYQSVVSAATAVLSESQYYEFSHKGSVNHKDVRMALIQAYYYLGNYKEAAKHMDILDPSNAPHPTNAALLLVAIQTISGSL